MKAGYQHYFQSDIYTTEMIKEACFGKSSPVFLPSVTLLVQSMVHVTIYQIIPTVYGALCSGGVAAYTGSACMLYSILDVIINNINTTSYLYS